MKTISKFSLYSVLCTLSALAVCFTACKPGGGGGEEPQTALPEWYYTGS